jgi:Lhr-like helicase
VSYDPLSIFSAPVRDWFARAFGEPTPPQRGGWPAIAAGSPVEPLLVELGFRAGPRRLTLSA